MGIETGGRRVRVGVTGHRTMADLDAVGVAVGAVLDRVSQGAVVALTCVSSLAEGADRLVARRVLDRPGGTLVVLLPLDAIDYANDFTTEASRQEFNDLLAAADEVEVIPVPPAEDDSREAAYERAGLAMLDRSDVVLALWDGQPSRGRGGTAEIVEAAHDRGLTVEVVPVTRPVTA